MSDAEFSLLAELLRDMRGEIQDARTEFREGLAGVHERLDVVNGRTRKSEVAIAQLEERSQSNVCTAHGERLKAVETRLDSLPADRRKTLAITGAGVTAILAIAEGVYTWAKHLWGG